MKNHLLTCLLIAGFNSILLAQTEDSASKTKLQELVVSGIKATEKKPLTFSAIDKKRLERLYYGADIPTMLQHTPSVNTYSDNGTGIGYSYFRLRGMDQTRINTTVNGVPINDPENQGVFFNNFADLASSAEEIQVQRGIGTSTNGTSAFGGSVNILTKNLSQNAGTNINMGMGSFGSSRLTAEMQTGLLNQHWMVYARLGQLFTNGYRTNSGSQIQSYQFSVGYVNKNSVLKFNFFGGNAQSKLAYTGIDKATFEANPKANPYVNNESDAFKQFFNQIQYSRQIGSNQSINASAYLVKGEAPKFEFLFPSSWGYGYDFFNLNEKSIYVTRSNDTLVVYPGNVMTSYRLNQVFYGAFANYQANFGQLNIESGLHVNAFQSDHLMEVEWANIAPNSILGNHKVYFNTGKKSEQSAFVKANYNVWSNFSLFADIQARHASFSYQDEAMEVRKIQSQVENMNWLFVNPRLGLRHSLNYHHSVYAMIGMSRREPTRFDYLQDDFAPRDIKQNEIKPEEVLNIEAGYSVTYHKIQGKINAFAMEFNNQIVGTGAINNFGYAITGNIGKSSRRGIELDFQGQIIKNLKWVYTGCFSKNRIKELNQSFNNTDLNSTQINTYKNTPLALSPEIIQQIGLQGNWFKQTLFTELSHRYVSKQFLDNTGSDELSIPSFQLLDATIALSLSKWIRVCSPTLSFKVNNILDQKYVPAGSVGGYNTINNMGARGQYSLYLPAAGRNFFLTLSIKF